MNLRTPSSPRTATLFPYATLFRAAGLALMPPSCRRKRHVRKEGALPRPSTTGPAPGPILGIETSCDETAAAVVAPDRRILSGVVLSQIDEHRLYGGVVPEIAADRKSTRLNSSH